MTREDLIYFAGLFDGEGTIGCYNVCDRNRPRLNVALGMCHKKTIEWCQSVGGGGITVRPAAGKWNTLYKWQLVDKRALEFMELLVPFLKTKKNKAIEATKKYRASLA